MGVDEIVNGGQTQNPSTNDFLDAFAKVHADHIFVFPNNSNIFLAAQQAAEIYDKATVHVLASKNIGTGYVAVSTANLDEPDPESIIAHMNEAMANVTAGYISPAIRDAEMNGVHIHNGDTIGIINKEIVVSEPERAAAAKALVTHMLENGETFMLTVFRGKDASEDEQTALAAYIEEAFPDVELYFIDGGQDIYPFIFVAE